MTVLLPLTKSYNICTKSVAMKCDMHFQLKGTKKDALGRL
jgi:hypothetical protein